MTKNKDEYEILLQNLEQLRSTFNIEMQEIDIAAELGKNTYSRLISKKQSKRIDELISISNKVYNLPSSLLLSPNLQIPSIDHLPNAIKSISVLRLGKSIRRQKKRDIIQYCILILNTYFIVGDNFTNSQIKSYLKGDLEAAFKSKSIEWHKSIISPFIEDTGHTQKAKTKSEKIYRLIHEIPTEMVSKATNVIGADWM